MNHQAFGKFPSLTAFLESYRESEKDEYHAGLEKLSVPEKAKKLSKSRDVVEVMATLYQREPDDSDANGGKHYRLLLRIREVISNDPDVAEDIDQCIENDANVFCAIRYGDAMGIKKKIVGLDDGVTLRLKGEWITSERAYSHGGEKASVLHFTHHPLGFICTQKQCYS